MVHHLEVPHALAGAGIEGDEGGPEEIRANAVGAIKVVGGGTGRHEHDPARGIDRQLAPRIRAPDVLPRIGRPGLVPELARVRNGVETPHLFPGNDVVGANVARRGEIGFAGRRAQDDEVLEDLARVRRLHAPDFAGESLPEVQRAIGAERQDRLASLRVDRFEVVVALEQEAPVGAIRTLPVIDAAWRDTLQVRMHPDFLTRRGVERHEGVVARQDERGVVHDERSEVVGEVVPGRVGPGDVQPRESPFIDLIQLDVAAVVRAAAVLLPGRTGGAPLASRTERDR